jgi:hypothetical protein
VIPLLLGTAIALTALTIVLAPLFSDSAKVVKRRLEKPDSKPVDREVEALREIEFDHVTGKLSEADYVSLRDQYTSRAVLAMRAEGVKRLSCPTCGPRPEADASYCSNCGAPLSA